MTLENSLNVVVSGKNPEVLERLVQQLGDAADISASIHVIKAGDDFPWDRSRPMPESLILALDSESLIPEPLRILGDLKPDEHPPTLVVGSGFDEVTVRFAMYCGARDFFAEPAEAEDLIAALRRLAPERGSSGDGSPGRLTAVVSAKGGAGASFIAANLAHMMAVQFGAKAVLVDLDFQYGVQPLYFDLPSNNGLVRAVETVEAMDAIALEGSVLKHKSGLHILSSSHNQVLLPGDLSEVAIAQLLELLKHTYKEVVVDLPRQIDAVLPAVAEHVDCMLIVLEQNLAGLQHAIKLMRFLRERVGLESSRIQFVINRCDKEAKLSPKDIKDALNGAKVSTLPSDWRCVNRSLDEGTPVLDLDARAAISRELSAFTARVMGREPEKKGLIARLTGR